MTSKDNNKMTEQAWKHLYNRLEQDGLLNETVPQKTTIRRTIIKWSAVAAILCVCFVSVFLLYDQKTAQTAIVILNNDENAPTLVSTLEDGSIVYLAQQTSLEYPTHFSKDKREVTLNGDAFFDISKDAAKPFIIDTKQIKIEVLGTSFNVKSRENELFSLAVSHGEVRVTSKRDGQMIRVKAGETALLHSDNLEKTQTKDIQQFQSYLKQIHFKDQRLLDVVNMINQSSDTFQIELTPGLENRLLTVTFSENTPHTMVQLICSALDLQFAQQQDKIIISQK